MSFEDALPDLPCGGGLEHFPTGSVQSSMKRALCLLLGWLALTFSAPAAGLIIVHDDGFWRRPPPRIVPPETYPPPHRPHIQPRPPQPVWAPLETSFTKADIRIRDQFATTAIEQEFYNPNPRQLEGTFLFPVPKGAQINKFTMEINGKPVEAELLAADKAKGIYEDIVRKLKDPALLEYAGRDLFKVRIFPIEPNSRKRITLSYTQLLKSDSGLVNLVFPLNTEKFSAKPLKTVSVKVDLETKRPLKSIYSPSHKVEIKRSGGNKAVVGYEASDVKPDADFQLFFAQEQEDLGLNLLTYKTAGEDGYFVLLASPGVEAKNTKVIPKDVAFVLDTSGSMAGA
jgi:Ca-activated chloride channel homolog